MIRARLPIPLLLVSIFPLSALAQDSEPPQLTAVRVLTPTVDVTNGAATFRAEFDITDDYSGVTAGMPRINFENTTFRSGLGGGNIISGTPFDGTYGYEVTIPAGSPPGERTLDLFLWDNEGRTNYLFDIATFMVTNNGPFDREPPTIHSITVEPKVVDLTNGPQTVTMFIEISDDYSGIASIWTQVLPTDPDSPVVDGRSIRRFPVTDGPERVTLEFSYTMGAYTPAGEWQFMVENLTDNVYQASRYNERPERLRADFDPTFEIINPNGDTEPPELIKVEFLETVANTAFETSFLPWRVQFADAPAGVELISVYAYAPGGADNYIYSGKIYDELNEVNINGDTLTGILEVPQFIEEGEHKIQVLMQDVANNRIRYGHLGDEPLPPGSTEFITVAESAGVDTQDIIVTDVSITPDPVDITDAPQLVTIQVGFTDDRSGLKSLRLGVEDPAGDSVERPSLSLDDLLTGSPTAGTLQTSFEIHRYSPPGEYRIDSLTTTDQAGNLFSDASYPVFPISMPSAFTVVNNGPVETQPPEILSVNIPRTVIEVIEERNFFPMTVQARDDLSGVSQVWIEYALEDDPESNILFIMSPPGDVVSEDGLTLTMTDDGNLRSYAVPGTYKLDSVRVTDAFGLRQAYDVSDPSALPPGLPPAIEVINSNPADREPPQVTDIRLSATEFDVSQYPGSLTIEIDFTDDVSGLWYVWIDLYNRDEFYRVPLLRTLSQPELLNFASGDRNGGTLRQVVEIPRYIPPRTYEVEYDFQDNAFRDTSHEGTDDDYPFGDTGFLQITNTGPVDFTNPQLIDFVYPESVDVSNNDAIVTLQVEVIDDLAGVNNIYIQAESPSGSESRSASLIPQLESGQPVTEGVFYLDMKMDAFAEAGEWRFSVTLRDRNDGYRKYEPADLEGWGLPSAITVVNTRPPGYLWKESDTVTDDGWREVEWFGWVQDQGDYPFVYHLEHGWIYTSGRQLDQFAFYELTLGIWWWIDEDNYPWMYADAGPGLSGWVYYYAPFGTPGNRWFYDPASGQPVPESSLFSD
jgi:hypothetical protein